MMSQNLIAAVLLFKYTYINIAFINYLYYNIGNFSSAYEFDGIDDFIENETSYDYQYRTVSFWAMLYDTYSERQIIEQDAHSLEYGAFGSSFKSDGFLYGNAGGTGKYIIYFQITTLIKPR